MKAYHLVLPLTLLFVLSLASQAFASTPAVEVMVSNSAGKLVYKGKTDPKGTFATPNLAAGSYVVQFNSASSLKGGPYALVVGAGKKKVVADSVPGTKFSKGGVAMRVEVPREMNLTGQVAEACAAIRSTADTKSNDKVKYINGKKYVWAPPALGSSLGGRWVEAGSQEARNLQNVGRDYLQNYQDRPSIKPQPDGN